MSKEDQPIDGNEKSEVEDESAKDESAKDDSTSDDERESEDASAEKDDDFDDLFSDEESDESNESPVSREEYNNLKKGAQKLASEIGRLKKERKEQVAEKKTEASAEVKESHSVIKNLYFKANPEAEGYWSEVEKEASALGKDPFELYESSSYLKGEAKSRYDAKVEEERSKAKIEKPSSGAGLSKKDISKLTAEEVNKLSPAESLKYMQKMAERESQNID